MSPSVVLSRGDVMKSVLLPWSLQLAQGCMAEIELDY